MLHTVSVNIPLQTDENSYNLPTIDALKNRHICGFSTVRAVNGAKTEQGKAIANDAVFFSSGLNLVTDGSNSLHTFLPVNLGIPLNGHNRLYYPLDIPKGKLSITACKLLIGNAAAIVAGESIVIIFHYKK